MMHQQDMDLNNTWSEDNEHLLPKITSLILEGLHTDSKNRDMDFKLFRNSGEINHGGIIHRFRLPSWGSAEKEISKLKSSGSLYGGRPISVIHHHGQMPFVRRFIGGLSHHYNNKLMGIWGNISLMGMLWEKEHPIQYNLSQIEGLIQNGSSLIHLLFGYLIERRTATRRLRLNQIIEEIKTYNRVSGNEIDFTIIKTSVIALSKIRNKTQLASCMARVMDQMLTMIQKKRISIDTQDCLDSLKAETHLEKIDVLLRRGYQMIRNLDYYAETIAPQKKTVNLKSIIRHHMDTVAQGHVAITQDLSASMPRMTIDACQIEYALKQLVDNARNAVDDNGKISIKLNTLNSEAPHERCGVHTLKNYAVITVTDNGEGMATSTQAQIFDPFYAGNKGQGTIGLGLAAAAGIIKSHGGYILVRSKPGLGSSVKIYLPE